MQNNVKIIIIIVLLSILAVIGAGLKYVSSLDQEELKLSFVKAFKSHTDLDISLNGDIKISYFPVAIKLHDVTVLNPEQFKTENLLSLKNIQARFQILPLLFKEIIIDKLALKEGYITLEIDSEGQMNWPLQKTTTEGQPSSFQLILENVSFENIAFQYLDASKNITKKVSVSSAKMSMTSMMESLISVNGRFEEAPLSVTYTGPTPQYLFTSKKNMANIGFKTRFSGTTFEIVGKIGPMIPETSLPALDVNAILIGGKLSALNPLLDTDFPDIGPYEISFGATTDEAKLDLKNLISKLKQNELTGDISFNLKDNYSYHANLNMGAINLQDFKNLNGNGNTQATEVDLSFLQNAQGKSKIAIKSIDSGDVVLSDISGNIEHTKEAFKLSDIKTKLFDGDLSGFIEVALNNAQNISSEFKLSNAPLEKIFDNGIANSPTEVSGFLHSYGKTLPDLTQNLAGDLVLKAGPGKMAKNKLALFERDLLFVFFPKEKDPSSGEADLNCLVTDIEIYKGLMGTSFFMLDTEHLTLGGLGTLDLNNEKIQFLLDPRPKNPKFISASTPLYIRGTLDNYSVTPTAGSILEKGIGIALTGLAGPLGILVPLLTTSTTGAIDKNPCELALKGQYKELDLFKDQQKGKTGGKINDVRNLFKMLDKEHATHSKN